MKRSTKTNNLNTQKESDVKNSGILNKDNSAKFNSIEIPSISLPKGGEQVLWNSLWRYLRLGYRCLFKMN